MFDLRSLEHSTILYEATAPPPSKNGVNTSPNPNSSSSSSKPLPSPLLRLAFSPTSPTYLSVCHADAADVQILDTRSPGVPAMEVRGHKAAVNGMAWGGSTMANGGETTGPGWLATVCKLSRAHVRCGPLTSFTCSGRFDSTALGSLDDDSFAAAYHSFSSRRSEEYHVAGTFVHCSVRDQRRGLGWRRRLGGCWLWSPRPVS